MADNNVGPSAPVVSVRAGHNRLTKEERELQAAKRERKRHPKTPYERYDDEPGEGGASWGRGHEDIADQVSVLGIPHEEMTVNVRRALDTLLAEINSLRGELSRAKGHEAYLEQQADVDRVLGVMRRRAFMGRLALAVRRVEEEQVEFSFLYIQVTNAAQVRGEFGHGALENLMVQAATALREGSEPGDVVGSLENFDFGIILPGTPLHQAAHKAARLAAILGGRSFAWQGQPLNVQARIGQTAMQPGDASETVVQRAKDDILQQG